MAKPPKPKYYYLFELHSHTVEIDKKTFDGHVVGDVVYIMIDAHQHNGVIRERRYNADTEDWTLFVK